VQVSRAVCIILNTRQNKVPLSDQTANLSG
jgi:hypothetical protein